MQLFCVSVCSAVCAVTSTHSPTSQCGDDAFLTKSVQALQGERWEGERERERGEREREGERGEGGRERRGGGQRENVTKFQGLYVWQ